MAIATDCEQWLNLPMISASDFQQGVAIRLKNLRLAMGKSQDELAEKLGVGASAISNYEKGVRAVDPYAALQLKLVYGAPLEWLYGGDESVLPPALADKLDAAKHNKKRKKRYVDQAALPRKISKELDKTGRRLVRKAS